MCGIVGIVNKGSKKAADNILHEMNTAITHRGPDEDGFFLKENVGLAMRRLSIIDLEGGQQPIYSADRSKTIVFNGEIYNFQELRKELEEEGNRFYTNSDTEVIVHLYEKYGVDCLQYLRGMFALAIWDETEKSLFIARDRLGQKPLLYSHQANGDLVFGSEFQALLQHPDISREVDCEAIDSYLSYLCVPAPQTAFRQIRKLEPGHWLRWKNGEIETNRYWLPDFSKKIKISRAEAEEETLRLLKEATKLRLISEVPLGAFLSGGVDSSAIVALMAQSSDKPVKTFSIGFEEQDFSELKYAKRVARNVGAEYNEFIVKPNAIDVLPKLVKHFGEPYADSSAIPTYYVAKETRKFVTVALNGDGGDESFAGYERHTAMRIAEIYHRIPKPFRKLVVEMPVNLIPSSTVRKSRVRDAKRFLEAASLSRTERYFRWMSVFHRGAKDELYTQEFVEAVSKNQPVTHLEKWFEKANGSGVLDATLLADQMAYLPNDLLVKVDIASMANSLEARSPFLDHKVIEFGASLPENIKAKRFETKSLLKSVAAKLVPKDVIYRRKMGFGVPIGEWLRGDMKRFAEDILLSKSSLDRGIIRPEVVTRYLKEHFASERDHAAQIWSMLMLELWFQQFID
ncbi:MAG: asparagine synthase (glutamine-hydrolyzing) [Pyrinomonadaceae bacterium]|nr:asparagine synthase (glutamine-hydrolyzing) [Pyrinomonadaceae bacterium]